MSKFFFIVLFCLGNFFCGFSKVVITDGVTSVNSIEREALVFVDSSNQLTIDDMKRNKLDFKLFTNEYTNLESNNTYWLKIRVVNKQLKTINWVLNFYDPDFKLIEFYDQTIVYTAGIDFPFTTKRFFHKNFVFPVEIKPNEERIYWVRMQSESSSTIKAYLTTIETHYAYSLSEYYLLGLYYGMLLILSVYNLILFLHTKYRTYLLYVLYLLCAMLFSFNEDGLGFQFLWSSQPWLNTFFGVLSPVLLQISFFVFGVHFLELEHQKGEVFGLAALFVLSTVMAIFQFLGLVTVGFSFGFYLLPFIYLLYVTWGKAQGKHSDSMYFLVGSSLVLASLFIYFFRLNNWVYSGIFEVYAFNFSILIEALALSMAVGNKIKNGIEVQQETQYELIVSLEEKEQLSTKVNRELASEVSRRTKELEEQKNKLEISNTELLHMKTKLYTMNEALDLANFKLKKEVHEFSKEKIGNKEITFESFVEIYGNQFVCLNYLMKLKLENQICCKKCGGVDFKSKDQFSKQCVKCKKIDSATSGTIFHSLKFPLQKAFYLLYITNYNKNKYTLDQLSVLLDLGRNSCWSFINKVVKKKEQLHKEGVDGQVSFDDLIL